jgi:hypothetical protein
LLQFCYIQRMTAPRRNLRLVLVLALFISQTALLAHAVNHTAKDGINCQLCLHQAEQSHCMPAQNTLHPALISPVINPVAATPASPDQNRLRSYFQRAPPHLSA